MVLLELGKLQKYSCLFCKNLVRQGNVHSENPNHFFFAVFSAFKDFRNLSKNEQLEYIQQKRNIITTQISHEQWLNYMDGFYSQHKILQEFIRQFLNPLCSSTTPIFHKILVNRETIID